MTKNKTSCLTLHLFSLCLLAAALALTGCDTQKQRDLSAYIDKLKQNAALTQTKTDITAMKLPVAAVYQSNNLRDPFEDATISYTEKGMVNPVNAFPLNMLRYTGMLEISGKRWAVIMVPDGRVYQITIADAIGDHYGKITKIDPDHIEVLEKATDDDKQNADHLVTLQLEEGTR